MIGTTIATMFPVFDGVSGAGAGTGLTAFVKETPRLGMFRFWKYWLMLLVSIWAAELSEDVPTLTVKSTLELATAWR